MKSVKLYKILIGIAGRANQLATELMYEKKEPDQVLDEAMSMVAQAEVDLAE